MNELQFSKVKNAEGFIAALDQSGGSTPKALKLYGIQDGAYSGDEEMFDLVHAMRTRIITSPSFNGDRILGSILFEMTMDRQIEGRGSADYLWNVKKVVPFLKVDKGLADEVDGAQVMKPMPGLDALLARAVEKGVFGTKMRSVIDDAVHPERHANARWAPSEPRLRTDLGGSGHPECNANVNGWGWGCGCGRGQSRETRPRMARLARPKLTTIKPSVKAMPWSSTPQSQPSLIRLRNPANT